jgi:putative ATP-binding cassette transporter
MFDLLWRSSGNRLVNLALLAGIAGVGNALVMMVASNALLEGGADFGHLVGFLLAILIYIVAQWGVIRGSAREIATIVHTLQLELVDAIRDAGVRALGALQAAEAFAAVTRDLQAISQAATALTLAAQAAFLLLFTALYLLWLAPVDCAVLLAATAAIILVLIRRSRQDRERLDHAVALERALLGDMTALLDGFKEAKASGRRALNQLSAIAAGAARAAEAKTAMADVAAGSGVAVQTSVYLVLALIVFALPFVIPSDPTVERRTVTALLFAAGSVTLLVQSLPIIAAAQEAGRSLAALIRRLPPETAGHANLPDGFPTLRDAVFTWCDERQLPNFQVGPATLALEAGELTFITGGNGSGKSTLLRMIAGLLPPTAGTLSCGASPITADHLQTYRDSIGVIPADLHLFRKPYGLVPDPAAVSALLEEYGLAKVVSLRADGAWSTVALSGGQRKRLAMVQLLLTSPRTVILDEWAADQDPEFRRVFYDRTLAAFRNRGCAVICATHDERFFARADRCYTMRDGHLLQVAPQRALEDST